MTASDMGWSIQCPDKCIRHFPYLKEEDADFDSMYITSRGCFDYSSSLIIPFEHPCPQGEHKVVLSMFDYGLGQHGSISGPCDVAGCIRRAKWRAGLIVDSSNKQLQLNCNIAIKVCNFHRRESKASDLISDREWELIGHQFDTKGVQLPIISEAKLSFKELHRKRN